MRWSEVMNKVAAALADRQLPDAEGDPDNPVSLLTALTGSIPPGLRRRLRPGPLGPLSQDPANNDVEPLIYQNEFPVRLLAAGTLVAELDGRYWTAETCAAFTGRVIGLFASAGTVSFASFRYRGTEA